MLSKKYRFHSRGGVKYVYRNGKTIRQQRISLIFAPNTKGFTRFAVVVSKKVERSAVKRNRLRRRIYEALRLNLDAIPSRMDYIFVIYSKEIANISFDELQEMLGKLVEESKMCYNKGNG